MARRSIDIVFKSELAAVLVLGAGAAAGLAACAAGGNDAALGAPSAEAPEPVVDEAPTCSGRPPTAAQSGRLELPIAVNAGQAPLQLAVKYAGDGFEYEVSFFAFYLSEPVLVNAAGVETRATLLLPNGEPPPYAVHLVNADEPETHALRLAAKPGSYTALKLGLGVPAPCWSLSPNLQVYPLNIESEMTWDWAGYLHLRIEGRRSGQVFQHHLFDQKNFTTVVIPGAITVGQSGSGPVLGLDVGRLLKPPAPGVQPAVDRGIEGWLMENMLTNQAFSLR